MPKIYQVDAFTHEPFKGNPAGIVLLSSQKSDDWMRGFAVEMNLPETAFLLKLPDRYLLRWFTPKVEVTLCGHATLASAHILFSEDLADKDATIIFDSASGVLEAQSKGEWIELNFPAHQIEPEKLTPKIISVLGFEPERIFRTDVNLLIEMSSFEAVRDYQPNLREISKLPFQGLIITSRMNDDFDFVSRYFAPRAGIDEDPVTGSSHCSLTPYWVSKLDKNEFTAYQASERGGVLKVKLEDDRVFIQGQAVTIFEGELQI